LGRAMQRARPIYKDPAFSRPTWNIMAREAAGNRLKNLTLRSFNDTPTLNRGTDAWECLAPRPEGGSYRHIVDPFQESG
jgi:hypothetical protein